MRLCKPMKYIFKMWLKNGSSTKMKNSEMEYLDLSGHIKTLTMTECANCSLRDLGWIMAIHKATSLKKNMFNSYFIFQSYTF